MQENVIKREVEFPEDEQDDMKVRGGEEGGG